MSIAARGVARRPDASFLTQGFRPFFLAAGLWSAAALALWIVMFATGTALPSRFDPLSWHIHEMLFGFVMAAVAGFLLTAIPNWTERLPVSGGPLAAARRIVAAGPDRLPGLGACPRMARCRGRSFVSGGLVGVVAREIVAGRNWRNLPMVAPVTVLGIANLLMHLEADGVAVPSGLGWRLGLAAVIVLISVVAGRIVPSFTRNWLAKRQARNLPAAPRPNRPGGARHPARRSVRLGVPSDIPPDRPHPAVRRGAQSLALVRWRGAATAAEPLLLVLHVGYAWLVLGAALLGLAMLDADLPQSAAIHTLTVGAIGTMILAVMTRVTRGHTGRELSADHATSAIYILVTLAAILRVAAAFAAGRPCRCWLFRQAYGSPPSDSSCCAMDRCCHCRASPGRMKE